MFAALTNDTESSLRWLGQGLHALAAAGLVLGGSLFMKTVYGPLEERRVECEMQSTRLQTLLADSGQIRAENARLVATLKQLQEQRAALERRVPDDPREAEFLEQVTEVAHDLGVHIHDYRPGTVSPLAGYSRMEIVVSCACSYAGMCDFLHRLATLPRLAHVTKLEILAPSPQEMYTVNMTLVIYFGVGKPTTLAQGGDHA